MFDDDQPYELTENRNPLHETLISALTQNRFQIPAGPIPDDQIVKKMREVDANFDDLQKFLTEDYPKRCTNGPPATWKHVTEAIRRWLGCFGKFEYSFNPHQREREQFLAEMRKERERHAKPNPV